MKSEIDIGALRTKLGWTQEQLAEYLGLDRSSVSRMESGQRPKGPTERLLRHLQDNPKDALPFRGDQEIPIPQAPEFVAKDPQALTGERR